MKKFLKDRNISGKHLSFKKFCHSVNEVAEAFNANKKDFVKNICLIDSEGYLIIAIVKGEDRADLSKIKKTLNIEKLRIATTKEILEKTSYPCGGVPSFGYDAIFLIDLKVMEKEYVYSGGGSENSLVMMSPSELLKTNNGLIVDIRN